MNRKVELLFQFVLFTFDDAVTAANYEYYKQAFYGRVNPDGCPVSSTYYVSHEYTDYSKVCNSITHICCDALSVTFHKNLTLMSTTFTHKVKKTIIQIINFK